MLIGFAETYDLLSLSKPWNAYSASELCYLYLKKVLGKDSGKGDKASKGDKGDQPIARNRADNLWQGFSTWYR